MTAIVEEGQMLELAHFYDFLVTVFEKYKGRLKKNNRLEHMLRLAVAFLAKIESFQDELDPNWAEPDDGFSEDDSSDPKCELLRSMLGSLDRIFCTAGRALSVEKFQPIFTEKMGSQLDWRQAYSAIMAASQISQED